MSLKMIPFLVLPAVEALIDSGQDVTTDKVREIIFKWTKIEVENEFLETYLQSLASNYSCLATMLIIQQSNNIAESMYSSGSIAWGNLKTWFKKIPGI